MAVSISPVASLGNFLLADLSNEWSIFGLARLAGSFLETKQLDTPLSVRTVMLSQSPYFSLDSDDLQSYLESLFVDEHCAWTCAKSTHDGHLQGLARTGVSVMFQHESLYSADLFADQNSMGLCLSLVGDQKYSNNSFFVVPEWRGSLTRMEKRFGSCITLAQLRFFFEDSSRWQYDNTGEGAQNAERAIWLTLQFFEMFGDYVSIMSDGEILKIWKVYGEKAGPKTQMLLDLINMWAKAIAMANKVKDVYGTAGKALKDAARAAIKDCERELSKIDMKDKIEFVRYTMRPLIKYNLELNNVLERMGTDITREVDVDLISRAIRGITASNVPFTGAISTLSLHVSEVRNSHLKWAAGAGIVAISLPFIPVTGPLVAAAVAYGVPVIGGASGVFAAGGVMKHWELREVKDFAAFGKELNIMETSARMYLLLALTKAGSFFPKGSDRHKEYAQLMLKNFRVNILDKSFQPNAFVLEKGKELHDRVQLSHEKFIPYAKGYGVQPKHEDTGLY